VAQTKTHTPVLVRAGSRVTMILQNGAARISTPGICLDNGELGSRVRVTNLATKQVLTAEIVDRGLVQARF
jgi:flagella basal body P-ring formation protein FlgA